MPSAKQYLKFGLSRFRRNRIIETIAKTSLVIYESYENKIYDPYHNGEVSVLRKLVEYKSVSCIFDVGANVGKWALMANSLFPDAQIHCFEIIDNTFEILFQNTKHIDSIHINKYGLSDKAGMVKVKHFPGQCSKSSLLDYPHNYNFEIKDATVITGDSYIEKNNITHIDFLKIDVEGVEGNVLKGLLANIKAQKIDIIQLEYGRANILSKFLLKDIYDFFLPYGYLVGKIYPKYVKFSDYDIFMENFIGPNILAVKKENKDLIYSLSQ